MGTYVLVFLVFAVVLTAAALVAYLTRASLKR
ncbi:Hypothetical protein NGAL_HAMBI2605_48830 [Neorhizobium galegae bv. orientalis]|nr:Hypothetical protein NGAL_HAMBI2605_48830 [Neorhizobium galegae bv. orientalis]